MAGYWARNAAGDAAEDGVENAAGDYGKHGGWEWGIGLIMRLELIIGLG